MSWNSVRFEELYAEPSRNGVYKSKEHHGEGVKIVNMGELFGYGIIGDQEMKRLKMTEREMERCVLNDGDLLFGRRSLVEEGAGKCSLVEGLSEPTTFESSIIRVRPNKEQVVPRFFYYWFMSHSGRGAVRAIVSGVNVKGIRGSDLRNIEVLCPPVDQQKAIADILSAYDDLIENNRRRMALLEESARLLYREWFVHLRFPGHEHVPVTDGVPEGWERKPLGEVTTLKYGKALKKDDRVPGEFPVYGSSGVVGTHEKALTTGPGIVVGRKGNVGSVYWCETDFHPIDTVYFIESDDADLFLYYALLQTQFISTDVAVPGLNRDFAHSRKLLLPPDSLRQLFLESVEPFHSQMDKLRDLNSSLERARDILLPRLMNGERLQIRHHLREILERGIDEPDVLPSLGQFFQPRPMRTGLIHSALQVVLRLVVGNDDPKLGV